MALSPSFCIAAAASGAAFSSLVSLLQAASKKAEKSETNAIDSVFYRGVSWLWTKAEAEFDRY